MPETPGRRLRKRFAWLGGQKAIGNDTHRRFRKLIVARQPPTTGFGRKYFHKFRKEFRNQFIRPPGHMGDQDLAVILRQPNGGAVPGAF
jgi:hypothetical protein